MSAELGVGTVVIGAGAERVIGSVVLAYVADRAGRGELTGRTPESYRENLCLFAQAIGSSRPVGRVTRRHVEAFLARPVSASTRRDRLSILRGFFSWCLDRGLCRADPTAGIMRIRQPRRLPRALPAALAQRAAVASADLRTALCLSLGLQEGLRCCEMSNLELGDIDFVEATMVVRGKGGHQRALPISEETMRALLAYLEDEPTAAGPVLRSRTHPHRGIAPDTIGGYLSAALCSAGVKATAHQLRHTCANDMLRRGANIREVQQALGHESLATTQIYLGLSSVADLRKAMGGRSYRQLRPVPRSA